MRDWVVDYQIERRLLKRSPLMMMTSVIAMVFVTLDKKERCHRRGCVTETAFKVFVTLRRQKER